MRSNRGGWPRHTDRVRVLPTEKGRAKRICARRESTHAETPLRASRRRNSVPDGTSSPQKRGVVRKNSIHGFQRSATLLHTDVTGGRPSLLGECQIQILDSLVDLRSVLVADCNAIDTGVLEREPHRRLAILAIERTLSHEFHAAYAHSLFA